MGTRGVISLPSLPPARSATFTYSLFPAKKTVLEVAASWNATATDTLPRLLSCLHDLPLHGQLAASSLVS